jgi:small-conductance mechanosensitive channel
MRLGAVLAGRAQAVTAVALLLASYTTAAADESAKVDAAPSLNSAPVVVDGVELFRVAGAVSFPAATRAENVRQSIVEAAKDRTLAPESVGIRTRDGRLDVTAGSRHIVTVAKGDTDLEGTVGNDIAQLRAVRTQEAITRYRAERGTQYLLAAALRAVAASAVFAVALVFTLWAFRRILLAIQRHVNPRIHSVRIRTFELVKAESLWAGIASALRFLRLLAVAMLIYFYIAYTLQQFPWTRAFGGRLTGHIIAPLSTIGNALVHYIPKLVFLIVLFYIVRYALRIARLFFDSLGSGATTLPRFDPDWAQPTHNIVRALIVLLAAVIAYPYLPGSGTAAFQGISIFAGLMLSLGASSFMASIIAGYTLTYRRAFRVGELIGIADYVGEVTEIRLLVTHLRTPKNEEIVIPNSVLLQSQITNYSRLANARGLILHTTVGVGYEVPWRQVEALLLVAAERTGAILKTPAPFVLIRSLDDFAIKYELNAFVGTAQQMLPNYAGLHRNILDVFNEHRVQIMTPAYEGDPAQPKIVPAERWYAAPAERHADLGNAVALPKRFDETG